MTQAKRTKHHATTFWATLRPSKWVPVHSFQVYLSNSSVNNLLGRFHKASMTTPKSTPSRKLGKERKGKERKGKERKGKEKKGK